jgi:vacuolar-type H+-ATPase subunit H
MELIKKIKEAEKQAQEIIEQSKADVLKKADADKKVYQKLMDEAVAARRQAISDAEESAKQQALAEVEELKSQAAASRQELRSSAEDKVVSAADKVVSSLKE